MNKKLSSLICFALIVVISIPTISIVFARKPDRGPLEKVVFIHYKKDYAKPPWAGGPGGPNGEDGHYTFLVKGAKWKTLPVTYVIDPDNLDGLSKTFIVSAITASVNEWESSTSTDLFDSYILDYESSWDGWVDSVPDERNEFVFGDYPDPDGDVIAVCVVWGHFRGPPGQREIIEFDILFDIDFTWGHAGKTNETHVGDTSVMDLQNIATHELGHGLGLGDLYDSSASEETMFGYSDYGETKKRTLYLGDVVGIQELYGPLGE